MKEHAAEQARLKDVWQSQRARLSFPEKIRILVEIQKRQATILSARGKKPIIWKID